MLGLYLDTCMWIHVYVCGYMIHAWLVHGYMLSVCVPTASDGTLLEKLPKVVTLRNNEREGTYVHSCGALSNLGTTVQKHPDQRGGLGPAGESAIVP